MLNEVPNAAESLDKKRVASLSHARSNPMLQPYASILCFYFVMPPKHSINLLEVISPLRDSVCISHWLVVLGQVGMFPQHTHLQCD